MHVEMRPVGSIRPYDNNPRINDPAVDPVAASIREFGFNQPIVVDEQGVIIVGHTPSGQRRSFQIRVQCHLQGSIVPTVYG
jgi:hypothetical protein